MLNYMLDTMLNILFTERDELRKDIEQLCMQQAGPSYLGIATRMHFQRYKTCPCTSRDQASSLSL